MLLPSPPRDQDGHTAYEAEKARSPFREVNGKCMINILLHICRLVCRRLNDNLLLRNFGKTKEKKEKALECAFCYGLRFSAYVVCDCAFLPVFDTVSCYDNVA